MCTRCSPLGMAVYRRMYMCVSSAFTSSQTRNILHIYDGIPRNSPVNRSSLHHLTVDKNGPLAINATMNEESQANRFLLCDRRYAQIWFLVSSANFVVLKAVNAETRGQPSAAGDCATSI
jgi:hypothetical protein